MPVSKSLGLFACQTQGWAADVAAGNNKAAVISYYVFISHVLQQLGLVYDVTTFGLRKVTHFRHQILPKIFMAGYTLVYN